MNNSNFILYLYGVIKQQPTEILATSLMIDQILKIAEQNPEGFTIYLPSMEFVKHGWVIANKETQDKFGRKGLIEVVEFAMNHNRIVGGYRNKDGEFQFDASIVEPDRQVAISLMLIHHQDCIYNLETFDLLWRGH